ncbi:hypothetical protein TL16_g00649 [Triparma laevis f. inornata]|uniref:Elongation factor P n=1 Tax=Triparma laevis f. inornata TaxID=1714386 RepID=A0A9W6ZCV4_9STRA|nr:hypothetical protein TL16_g00649 [Triparma laevis f. inornata]
MRTIQTSAPLHSPIKAGDIRVGNVLDLPPLARVTSVEKVKPGKGGAFATVTLQTIDQSKKKLNKRFRTDEKVEKVSLGVEEKFQVLYVASGIECMNLSTFDQITVESHLLTETELNFCIDGTVIGLQQYNNEIVNVVLPKGVEIEIQETEPQPNGATAKQGAFKSSVLANGVRCMVPPFLETGDIVEVDPRNGEYMNRVSKS